MKIRCLLVDAENGAPIQTQNVTASFCDGTGKWKTLAKAYINSVGSGWYDLSMPDDVSFPLSVVARSNGSQVWRDLFYHDPYEIMNVPSFPEVPPTDPPPAEPPPVEQPPTLGPAVSINPLDKWLTYCDDAVSISGKTIKRHRASPGNCQAMTLISVQKKAHVLLLKINASARCNLQIQLLQNSTPHAMIGLDQVLELKQGLNEFRFPFNISEARQDARLRFWLVNLPIHQSITVEKLALHLAL